MIKEIKNKLVSLFYRTFSKHPTIPEINFTKVGETITIDGELDIYKNYTLSSARQLIVNGELVCHNGARVEVSCFSRLRHNNLSCGGNKFGSKKEMNLKGVGNVNT